MGERDILVEIARLLAKNKIPYLLTGSFAVSYYGYPRSTHDIDFILEIPKESMAEILKVLAELNKDYDYSVTDIKDAISRASQFNIFHLESGIKLDFWIAKNDEFEKGKFVRSKTVRIMKQRIAVISAEDLILNKLLWCREVRSERHMRD
ncbi:nucleotidyltransferase, partial [Candidatus Gottesmanbacteria bacterium]|nr:nucleotidyltransferase [Candidatus Gottesmanbacteria bacterium]